MSLTVKRKLRVLDTELSASTLQIASPPNVGVTFSPDRIVESLGKYLVGDVVEPNEIKFGPDAFVIDATLLLPVKVFEVSYCSQLYVMGSPSGSVAEPVRAKAVEIGMVRLLTAETTGALFAVIVVVTGHVLEARLVWI